MKKFFSLSVIILALIGTWKLIKNEPQVNFETHSSIQLEFAKMIEEALIKHRPNFQNLKIQKIWTEAYGENKVKAHYQYSFFDADTNAGINADTGADTNAGPVAKDENSPAGAEQIIRGEALLRKESSTSALANNDTWFVEKVQTKEGVLIFQEGSTISPEEDVMETPREPLQENNPGISPENSPEKSKETNQ